MPDDKKKQAMSLLFGDAPRRPATVPALAADAPPPPHPVAKTTSRQVAKSLKRPGAKAARASVPDPQREVEAQSTPDPYYQGASRYRRSAGDQVKHSVYLDPDVSQAIKVAAALGDDARGSNVSAIVNGALRELGYGAG